jgi:hypothetical protein
MVVHTLETPKPHSTEQRILMQAFSTPGLSELWVACGTKFGKSIAAASGLSATAFVRKGQLFRWVAPIYAQTKIGYNYCKRILPGEPVTTLNKSEPSITIEGNDTKIEFRSGKHPEDLEGEAVSAYCLDECAKMTQQVYESAKTTTTVTRGTSVSFSTPRGKDWFWAKCMMAKEEMEWAQKRGKAPTKIFLTAPSISNPAVSREAVAEAKKNLPKRLFEQYYLASFLDDGNLFCNLRECLYGPELEVGDDHMQEWAHESADEAEVVIGVDWAKKQDHTVFVALAYDEETPRVVGFQRFQSLPYTESIRELVKFMKRFKQVGIIYHDRTGVGDAIEDMMGGSGIPFHGVVFSMQSKSALVNNIMLAFERKTILIPFWRDMLRELEAYEIETTAMGNCRYSAPKGEHDDIVTAIMLAFSAAQEYSGRLDIRFIDELPKETLTLDKWYNGLIEDHEEDQLVWNPYT